MLRRGMFSNWLCLIGVACAISGGSACAGIINSDSTLSEEWHAATAELTESTSSTADARATQPAESPFFGKFRDLNELLQTLAELAPGQPASSSSSSSSSTASGPTNLAPPDLVAAAPILVPEVGETLLPPGETYHPRMMVNELLRPPRG